MHALRIRVDAVVSASDGGDVLVLNTLAPVFLLIAIGAVLQRTGFVSPGFLKEANRLTYWLGLPALLFSELASSFHHASSANLVLTAMAVATGLVVVAAYIACWVLRLPACRSSTPCRIR